MRTHTTITRTLAILGLTGITAGGCSDAPSPVAPVVPTAASLAKGGPNMPPTNGRIYFTSNFAGSFDVYSIKPDGSDRRRLTLTADDERFLNVSSDGKKLVVASRRADGGGRELLTMNADGTNRRVLLSTGVNEALGFPAFSPDGRTIVYMLGDDPSDQNAFSIWTVSASGGKATRLTAATEVGAYPSWSPDGSRIVYSRSLSGSGDRDLYIMNADGSAPQLLHDCATSCLNPIWSPDGSQVIYLALGVGAFLLESCDLRKAVPQCGTSIPQQGSPSTVALSPDGSQLVYSAQTYENNTSVDRITISNVNGTGQTALTANLWAVASVAWGR